MVRNADYLTKDAAISS